MMKTIRKVRPRTSIFSRLSEKIIAFIFIGCISHTVSAQQDAVKIGTVAGFYESLKPAAA